METLKQGWRNSERWIWVIGNATFRNDCSSSFGSLKRPQDSTEFFTKRVTLTNQSTIASHLPQNPIFTTGSTKNNLATATVRTWPDVTEHVLKSVSFDFLFTWAFCRSFISKSASYSVLCSDQTRIDLSDYIEFRKVEINIVLYVGLQQLIDKINYYR